MNLKTLALSAILVVLALPGCARREHGTITGGYGNALITGQVVMQGTADRSPAGVVVSVRGTGMSAVLGADGKFAFADVPEGADLDFHRPADGIHASLRLEQGASQVMIELGQNAAVRSTSSSSSRRRGVGRGGDSVYEFEGLIRSVTADALVVFTSKGEEVTIRLTAETIIRKGDQVVAAADLVAGARVHVKTTKAGEVFSAILVIVQNTNDDGPRLREYEGTVKSVSAAELVMTAEHGSDITFVLDASTVVRKGDGTAGIADLAVGQRVHVKANVAADGTKTAVLVTIQREERPPEPREYEGIVRSVSSGQLVLTVEHGGDTTFVLDASTVVRRGDALAGIGDLAAGQRVHVKANVAGDGTKTAVLVTIQREERPPEPREYEGIVSSVSAAQLVLAGRHGESVTFVLDASTVVRRGDRPATVSDLAAGQRVQVKANVASDGTKTAVRVTIEGRD
jgi:hypothetical protein